MIATLVVASGANAFASPVSPESKRGTLGIDMDFLLQPKQLKEFAATPGADRLDEIVELGAKVLEWVDLLQKDLPFEQREQIWRRSDRLGHEPTWENPMYYNEKIILEQYDQLLAATPKLILDILRSGKLPATPPSGYTIKDIVDNIRPIHVLYSRTSRWLVLYDWRFSLNKTNRDFRGVLTLVKEHDALTQQAADWATLSESERALLVAKLVNACPMGRGASESRCQSEYRPFIKSADAGKRVAQALSELEARGRHEINSRFGVLSTHEGARTKVNAGFHSIEIPTYGIETDVFNWIQDRVSEAWTFGNDVGVKMFSLASYSRGAVRVRWEKGALPNVNGVGGDVITMDANTPKWLEHTQITMRHEMGHVLGFTDCYTEFWDEDLGAFTYYSLDPSDAMCALSGQFLPRHRDALIKGYFND